MVSHLAVGEKLGRYASLLTNSNSERNLARNIFWIKQYVKLYEFGTIK